jgi:hypothetical protein
MISTNNRPSGLRKWLALPVLLAVMALSCSKEQGAVAANENRTPPPPSPLAEKVKRFTTKMDSIKIKFADGRSAVKQFKEVYIIGAFKDSIKVSGDPAKVKGAPEEIVIEGYTPAGSGREAEKDPK